MLKVLTTLNFTICHWGVQLASDDMKDDITNVISKGTTWAEKVCKSVNKIQSGLKKPIKRRKIKIFTTYAKKMNIPQKDLKVKEVLCTRDIWGRLVYLAAVQNLELEHVMSYRSSTTCSY